MSELTLAMIFSSLAILANVYLFWVHITTEKQKPTRSQKEIATYFKIMKALGYTDDEFIANCLLEEFKTYKDLKAYNDSAKKKLNIKI